MTNEELQKAIEVAEESVEGFAEEDSFEMLLAKAVLELKDRLNNEREACAKIADKYADGLERNYSEIIADAIRARGQE
jgi:hypothetical protein